MGVGDDGEVWRERGQHCEHFALRAVDLLEQNDLVFVCHGAKVSNFEVPLLFVAVTQGSTVPRYCAKLFGPHIRAEWSEALGEVKSTTVLAVHAQWLR